MGLLITDNQGSMLSGNTTMDGTINISGDLQVDGNQTFGGDTLITQNTTISGSTIMHGGLDIYADIQTLGGFEVRNPSNFHDQVTVHSGDVELTLGNVYVGNNIYIGALTTGATGGALIIDNNEPPLADVTMVTPLGDLHWHKGMMTNASTFTGGTFVAGTSGTDGSSGSSGTSGTDGIGSDGSSGSSGTSGTDAVLGNDVHIDGSLSVGPGASASSLSRSLATGYSSIATGTGCANLAAHGSEVSGNYAVGMGMWDGSKVIGDRCFFFDGSQLVSKIEGTENKVIGNGAIKLSGDTLYTTIIAGRNCSISDSTGSTYIGINNKNYAGLDNTIVMGLQTVFESGVTFRGPVTGLPAPTIDATIPDQAVLFNMAGVITGSTGFSYDGTLLTVGTVPNPKQFKMGGNCRMAVGYGAAANSNDCFAFGAGNTMSGFNSYALGVNNTSAAGDRNVTVGLYGTSCGSDQVVLGQWNNPVGTDGRYSSGSTPRVVIATGDSHWSDRKNAIECWAGGRSNFIGEAVFEANTRTNNAVIYTDNLTSTLTWLAAGNMTKATKVVVTSNQNITDTITINLPHQLTIDGVDYGHTSLNAATGLLGKPMFIVQSAFSLINITCDGTTLAGYGSGNTAENCMTVNTNSLYIEVKNFLIKGFKSGISSHSNSEFWIMEGGFVNCWDSGVKINTSASGAKVRSTLNDYTCTTAAYSTYIGMNILSGASIYFSSENDTSQLAMATQTVFSITPSSVTYTDISITGLIWNSVGLFKNSLCDFTNPVLADLVMKSNVGVEDMNPHAKLGWEANTGSTTIATQSKWYKPTLPATPNGANYYKKFTPASNRLTYNPTHSKDALMWISGSLLPDNNTVTNWQIAVVRNGLTGTTYGRIGVTTDQSTRAFNFSTNVYIPDMLQNDYVEIWIRNTSNNTINGVVQDLNWLVDTR